jgi:ketosteroid isomerase-like protein
MKRHRTTSGNLRKKANCILCLFVGVLLAALGNAAEVRSDEEQILKLEDDWVRALQNHDRESLDKIVAPEFTFIEPNGTIRNRQQYLADRTSHEADIKTFQNDELKVRVFGNSALASGLAKITEHRQGRCYRLILRWKELWLKNLGTWQVCASQATPVNAKWDAQFIVTEHHGVTDLDPTASRVSHEISSHQKRPN